MSVTRVIPAGSYLTVPIVKLTDIAIQRFKADPGTRVDYFDASFPGFGVRVSGPTPRVTGGRKSWMLFYRHNGRQSRITFDPPYPALGLADARRKAGEALAQLSQGIDPAGERLAAAEAAQARKADTMESVVDEFMRRRMAGKAPRYVQETRRNFDNHVLPRWRNRELTSIKRRDVIELLDAIADGGTEVRQPDGRMKRLPGGGIAANRVLAAVRALFNWAVRRGILEVSPATLVERPGQETRRERVLTADELRAVLPVMQAIDGSVGAFFRMVLLTGQRREETATMQWADVDLDAGAWTIPAARTKAGRSHVVPLAPAAVALLRSLPRVKIATKAGHLIDTPHVFTIGGDRPISHYSVSKRRLDAAVTIARSAAGLDPIEPWTLHDLRRTAATEMGRLGVPRFIIGRVLNHADRSVTSIYDRHTYIAEKRQALEAWADYLAGLVPSSAVKQKRNRK